MPALRDRARIPLCPENGGIVGWVQRSGPTTRHDQFLQLQQPINPFKSPDAAQCPRAVCAGSVAPARAWKLAAVRRERAGEARRAEPSRDSVAALRRSAVPLFGLTAGDRPDAQQCHALFARLCCASLSLAARSSDRTGAGRPGGRIRHGCRPGNTADRRAPGARCLPGRHSARGAPRTRIQLATASLSPALRRGKVKSLSHSRPSQPNPDPGALFQRPKIVVIHQRPGPATTATISSSKEMSGCRRSAGAIFRRS